MGPFIGSTKTGGVYRVRLPQTKMKYPQPPLATAQLPTPHHTTLNAIKQLETHSYQDWAILNPKDKLSSINMNYNYLKS